MFVRDTIFLDRKVAFSTSSVPDGDASIGIVIIEGGFFKGEKSQRLLFEKGQSTASIGTDFRNPWCEFVKFVWEIAIDVVDWNGGRKFLPTQDRTFYECCCVYSICLVYKMVILVL
jgi:hypothetical protein